MIRSPQGRLPPEAPWHGGRPVVPTRLGGFLENGPIILRGPGNLHDKPLDAGPPVGPH